MAKPYTYTNQEQQRMERMRGELATHRDKLRAAGYDPDYIGITEVAQPHCPGCHRPIPWAVLKRYSP